MNKQDLISKVAEISGQTKKQTAEFYQALVEAIVSTVASGEKVQASGLGTFDKRATKGQEGTIRFGSRKGEAWKTEDSHKPSFKASKSFNEAVKGQ